MHALQEAVPVVVLVQLAQLAMAAPQFTQELLLRNKFVEQEVHRVALVHALQPVAQVLQLVPFR